MSILGRYSKFPVELFRMTVRPTVVLRDHVVQMRLGRTSFDVITQEGIVHPRTPRPPGKEPFLGPNGMSLRPGGPAQGSLLLRFSGNHLFDIPAGAELPKHLVLLHEYDQHFSLQTTEPVALDELNRRMTEWISQFPLITKEEYFKRFPLPADRTGPTQRSSKH